MRVDTLEFLDQPGSLLAVGRRFDTRLELAGFFSARAATSDFSIAFNSHRLPPRDE